MKKTAFVSTLLLTTVIFLMCNRSSVISPLIDKSENINSSDRDLDQNYAVDLLRAHLNNHGFVGAECYVVDSMTQQIYDKTNLYLGVGLDSALNTLINQIGYSAAFKDYLVNFNNTFKQNLGSCSPGDFTSVKSFLISQESSIPTLSLTAHEINTMLLICKSYTIISEYFEKNSQFQSSLAISRDCNNPLHCISETTAGGAATGIIVGIIIGGQVGGAYGAVIGAILGGVLGVSICDCYVTCAPVLDISVWPINCTKFNFGAIGATPTTGGSFNWIILSGTPSSAITNDAVFQSEINVWTDFDVSVTHVCSNVPSSQLVKTFNRNRILNNLTFSIFSTTSNTVQVGSTVRYYISGSAVNENLNNIIFSVPSERGGIVASSQNWVDVHWFSIGQSHVTATAKSKCGNEVLDKSVSIDVNVYQ